MTNTIRYEWGVVEHEGCSECWHDSKTTLHDDFDHALRSPLMGGDSNIFLERGVYNEKGEKVDSQRAYVSYSGLPLEFDGGDEVPQKYIEQVNTVEEI